MDFLVVLIDDNSSSNYYHKIIMEECGYDMDKVVEFSSSKAAKVYLDELSLEKEIEHKRIVILLDINMPITNGWQFLSSLEGLDILDICEIYLVSNSRHPKDIQRAEENILVKGLFEKHLDESFFQSLLSIN